jgi:hypothetical protein
MIARRSRPDDSLFERIDSAKALEIQGKIKD